MPGADEGWLAADSRLINLPLMPVCHSGPAGLGAFSRLSTVTRGVLLMSRYLVAALAAFVALIVSFAVIKTGTSQVATVGISTAEAASKTKMCKSRLPSGKMKTWRCGTDQACCVNHSMGLYVCGFAGLGCL